MKPEETNYLLDEAIKAIAETTDVKIKTLRREVRGTNRKADAHVQLQLRETRHELWVEAKTTVNTTTIAHLAHALGDDRGKWLLVTPHVTPRAAQKLRDLRIQFIDVAGNAYIDLANIYIYVQGRKLPTHWHHTTAYENIWTAAGVKVVFAILRDPDLANHPYRELAERANVALGTIAGVMKTLIGKGYVHNAAGANDLRNRKQLLDTWTVAYAEKLRPKTLIGTFHMRDELATRDPRIKTLGAQWGGEVAAAQLTGYLKPEVFTLYADKNVPQLLVALKLVHDPDGRFEVRRKFWRDQPGDNLDYAPPMLVYADLLATDHARNTETARQLYEEHVRGHLQID